MDPAPVIESAGVRYGVLGAISALLVIAIIMLWRHGVKREDQIAAERKANAEADQARAVRDVEREKARELRDAERDKAWELRLQAVKLEAETEKRELSEKYAEELTEVVRESHARESEIHARYTGTIGAMHSSMSDAQNKTAAMLEKLTDRITPQPAQPPYPQMKRPKGPGEY